MIQYVWMKKMQNSFKAQIYVLIRLQEIDTEIKCIELMLASVTEKHAALDSRLEACEFGLEQDKTLVDEVRKKYRAYESDTKVNTSMAKKSEERLRSVKTNKEYQSILKEIEDLKSKNSVIEDAMLECLDRIEDVEKNLEIKTQQYAAVSAQIASEKKAIINESKKAGKKLQQLKADWDVVSGTIQPELLSTFLRVKEKIGTAVVPVIDAVCQGCHLNIPPQMFNELQRNDILRFCPQCQRIIFWRKTE